MTVFSAKRGDICLVPHVRNVTAMRGPTTRATSYSMVTSVTRDGLVKDYARFVDYASPRFWVGLDKRAGNRSGSICGCTVAAANRFAKPVRDVLEAVPQEFQSLDAARDALRPFLAGA